MGVPELLTKSYIEECNYIVLARYIFNEVLAEKPFFGSKKYRRSINDIKIEVDVLTHEEDFELFQVDQLKLNHISILDSIGLSIEGEEEIGDLIDELFAEYNQEQVTEVERDYKFSYT